MSEPSATSIAISFFAPFGGVGLAFLLDRLWERRENDKKRKRLLLDLRDELTRSKDLLNGNGNLILTDIWSSTLASGSGRLLTHDALAELSGLYFTIEAWNYEAKRGRDIAEEVHKKGIDKLDLADPKVMEANPLADYWIRISDQLRESEKKLRQTIESVLSRPWWNPNQSGHLEEQVSSKPSTSVQTKSASNQNEFEREERRGLVALGLLAVAAAAAYANPGLTITIWIWTVYAGNLLYALILLWGGYAVCTLIYLSDDLFQEGFRLHCKRWGLAFLFLYPFFIIFTVAALLLSLTLAVLTPPPLNFYIGSTIALVLTMVMAYYLGKMTGRILRLGASHSGSQSTQQGEVSTK